MRAKIDSHGHVFARASTEFPREISQLMPEDRQESVEKLLAEMENNRIDQAVLVQTGGANIASHTYLLHCLKSYPQHFLGIGLIPPDTSDCASHMDRLAENSAIIGFRLSALGGPRDPFAPIDVSRFETFPIWKYAAEQDYVLWLYLRAMDAHLIPYLLEEFPQVRVVINHLGICPGRGKFSVDQDGRPQVETPSYNPAFHTTHRLARYENVMIHLSGQYAFSKEAYPYRDLAGWHRSLVGIYSAERLMWATDFPWIFNNPGYGKMTRIIDELLPELSEHEYNQIMGGNAKRFLRFPDCQN